MFGGSSLLLFPSSPSPNEELKQLSSTDLVSTTSWNIDRLSCTLIESPAFDLLLAPKLLSQVCVDVEELRVNWVHGFRKIESFSEKLSETI